MLNNDEFSIKNSFIYDIIRFPVLSEKSHSFSSVGKVCFVVDKRANKRFLKDNLEEIFNKKIKKINIINVSSKKKKFRNVIGYSKRLKKAIVTFESNEFIDLLSTLKV